MQIPTDVGFITLLAILFSTGLISGMSPCTLPTVLFVVAYVSGNKQQSKHKGFVLSLSFVLGIAFLLSMLGLLAGYIGHIFIDTKVFNYIIAAILIVMGLWLLKVIEWTGGSSFLGIKPKRGSGAVGAFLLGIPFGISASPCTLPIMVSVLAYAAAQGSPFYGMLFMFVYAIGRSIPILVLGTFTDLLKKIQAVNKYQPIIEQFSGGILVVLALYFIWIA